MQITTAYGDLDPVLADAIAQEFVTNRSSAWVKNVAERWITNESVVTAIAQDVADGTFKFRNIYESAPLSKGTKAMPKPMSAVTATEIQEMRTAIARVGTGPTQIAGLAQRFNISESDMSTMATALTTAPPKPKVAITESGAAAAAPIDPRRARILYEAAQDVLDGAERAELDLSKASLSDLEAYATMGIARQAWNR